ncbi:Glycosyltransferase involved in cell wall bisynthesis [Ectothiorhodospira mobilis]|uniref:Glycosyltransferase involved in cell wall bisynthesis n=1 Tax=Ectothiorhodospira mobilis TaxID=195064 RepID=A0A1I4QHY4_ECTMO|nr:glycosyltransferase family 4 protein [Ectothiorhodospira mobilis]SFM39270.1 Glycosyltransferase involved in cell wall bisynthesis [Ectothiorhodospira mobilis]
MKIAQIAPLHESVPPRTYGGTERVVHYLTEALVAQGHQVTLFASGDSRTSAELRPIVPEALRLSRTRRDPLAWHLLQLNQVAREAEQFDILHFHTDFLHFPLWRRMRVPQLTTLHGRLDLPDLQALFAEFGDMPVVSIAQHQREPLPMARWIGTVYNGIPAQNYTFRDDPQDYLAFLGRMSPEKGAETAIQIALRAGVRLRMAAKVDRVDRDYFDERIRPHLDHPLIEFIGEVDERGKNELLGGARALLFPIAWPEPFGLVMIEAMACGTPVIAYRMGSVPEVMEDGVTGYVVDGPDAAVEAIGRLDAIDRHACRRLFETHFSARRMAEEYVTLYRRLLLQTTRPANDATAPLGEGMSRSA